MRSALLFIDWKMFLVGEQEPLFLLEVFFRTVLMFIIILVGLRILGKRSVAQLSVFELGVIIGLGSAAGDPMFYKEVGMVSCLIVFGVVIGLNRLLTVIINRSDKLEKTLEGKPIYLIEKGELLYKNFKSEPVAQNELFTQLRLSNVSQLGQVRSAIIETNGSISIFFHEEAEVKWGLPVMPHLLDHPLKNIDRGGRHACTECSLVKELSPGPAPICERCHHEDWVEASIEKRIT